jgi:hypothetical protein
MQDLAEVRFNDNRIVLKDNRVKTAILPMVSRELERDVTIQGNCILEGAVFARKLEIQQGPARLRGAVFTQLELHVNTDSKGSIVFEKAVSSSQAVVSHSPGSRLHFLADLSARRVHLRNAYVSASIFADEIVLEDCVVIGGVFATKSLELHNCVVGTFNSPAVRASKLVYLLFPSAFSVGSISSLPDTTFFNLTLADLGALMRKLPCSPNTGKIRMDLAKDEVRTVLVGEDSQQVMKSYSVVGKVLAADLLDIDKLQNHFLLSCAALGNQLARTYDLGLGSDGKVVDLKPESIADFFFDILNGKVSIPDLDGRFDLNSIIGAMNKEAAGRAPEALDPTSLGNVPLSMPGLETGDGALPSDEGTKNLCAKCGKEAGFDSAFCEHCGNPLR